MHPIFQQALSPWWPPQPDRQCRKCGAAYTDHNQAGLCPECYARQADLDYEYRTADDESGEEG